MKHSIFRTIPFYVAVLSCFAGTSDLYGQNEQRPNFLFIIADDQSPFDLKLYNSRSTLDTPHIDQLAKRGMLIQNAYQMGAWAGGVCTPSRHMIMSGRTVWHIPDKKLATTRNPNQRNTKLVPPDLANQTMAAVFNRNGYATMRTCKKGNSYSAANKHFSVLKEATRRGGTDEMGSAWHAKQVLEYLEQRKSKQEEKPFLIYLGFSHPHDVRDGKPELLKKYGAVNHKDKKHLPRLHENQPQLPINYLEKHPFHHGHPNCRDEVRVSGVWERRDEQTIRNELGRQFACSENIDIQIGKVLQKLKDMKELDNTYVIYTADHGMAIGRHGLQGKQNLYDHTWRVPFIVTGPGIEPGSKSTGNIYLLDVLATFCQLAGIKKPSTVEGKSFRDVLYGKQQQTRDTVYGVYCGGTKPGMRCVKKGSWKLIKYDVMDGSIRKTQLFDLSKNPHEFLPEHKRSNPMETNLADNPSFAAKRKEMEGLLLNEMKRLDDPYRLWDQPQ